MSVEENLRLVDASIEAINANDLDRYVGLYATSAIEYDPGLTEPLKGRAAIREYNKAYFTAFPDVHARKERAFGHGDWICYEAVFTATHTGPFAGPGGQTIPATNKRVRLTGCTVAKVEGGEFTEVHNYFDQLAMMTQLGLAP